MITVIPEKTFRTKRAAQEHAYRILGENDYARDCHLWIVQKLDGWQVQSSPPLTSNSVIFSLSKCPACGYYAFNGVECFDCGYRP